MKTLNYIAICITLLFVLFSCSTTSEVATNDKETVSGIGNEPEVVIVGETEEVQILDESEQEYARSVAGLEGEISFDLFQSDKNEILAIIEKLDESMETRDYLLWRSYLTPSSISYWSNKMNLQVLSTRLPGDTVILRDLSQYFTNLFIPSRIGREVTEIRYNSTTSVKAVQVQGDTDIIYYDFVKENGKWLVQLQRL